MRNFILKVKDCQTQEGKVNKVIGNATLKSFVELITNSDLDANPRNARKSSVTESISETLHEAPELFQFMSKGVLLAAHSAEKLDRSRFRLSIKDSSKEGVLDGGHNTFTIGRFILEKTGYPQLELVRSWENLKEHWGNHINEIVKLRDTLPDILIPVEILHPASGPSGIEDFEDSILQISAARNNNAQLKETAKANQAGLYSILKENIDCSLSEHIEWRENDGGRIKAPDLVALSLIALSALPPEEYPIVETIRSNPNVIFSSKGQCVKIYNDFMRQEGVTRRISGDRTVEIIDPKVKSALALIKDIPHLYDLIYKNFPKAYNNASPGFGKITSVRTLDPAKWKNDKKNYMRQAAKTKFYQYDVDYSYPDGFIYPLVVMLSELMEINDNLIVWKKNPGYFIENKLSIILKSGYQSIIKAQDYDPGKVGKEKGAYELVATMYRLSEHL